MLGDLSPAALKSGAGNGMHFKTNVAFVAFVLAGLRRRSRVTGGVFAPIGVVYDVSSEDEAGPAPEPVDHTEAMPAPTEKKTQMVSVTGLAGLLQLA